MYARIQVQCADQVKKPVSAYACAEYKWLDYELIEKRTTFNKNDFRF